MRLPHAPYIRSALTAFCAALVLMVTAFVRAVHVAPVMPVSIAADTSLVRATRAPAPPEIDVEAVGDNDIFQPDRSAMPSRYRMPGESDGNTPPPAEPPRPTVLGTVVATDGQNYATCQVPGGRPTIVHVGDVVGGYAVLSIERTKVVFKSPAGAQIEIPPL